MAKLTRCLSTVPHATISTLVYFQLSDNTSSPSSEKMYKDIIFYFFLIQNWLLVDKSKIKLKTT